MAHRERLERDIATMRPKLPIPVQMRVDGVLGLIDEIPSVEEVRRCSELATLADQMERALELPD